MTQFIALPRVYLVLWGGPVIVPTASYHTKYRRCLCDKMGFRSRRSCSPEAPRIPSVDKVARTLHILIWKVLWMESEMLFISLFLKWQIKEVLLWTAFRPPEEVWRSNNHVLKVLKGQTSVIVQVSLIYDLLTNHPHLFLGQLVPCQFVQGLLQVWLAYEVIIVKILTQRGK